MCILTHTYTLLTDCAGQLQGQSDGSRLLLVWILNSAVKPIAPCLLFEKYGLPDARHFDNGLTLISLKLNNMQAGLVLKRFSHDLTSNKCQPNSMKQIMGNDLKLTVKKEGPIRFDKVQRVRASPSPASKDPSPT